MRLDRSDAGRPANQGHVLDRDGVVQRIPLEPAEDRGLSAGGTAREPPADEALHQSDAPASASSAPPLWP